MAGSEGDITQLLHQWRQGDEVARSQLFDLVYEQLHHLAIGILSGDQQRFVIQPTELVSECSLRLLKIDQLDWQDRTHFQAMVITTMRRVLIDQARKKQADKRRGADVTLLTSHLAQGSESENLDLLALDDALVRLEDVSQEKARVVELKYFGGLSHKEIAEVVGVSESTVDRNWRWARVWLYMELDA